jgi:excisionase family DNA binding protein
MGGTGALVDRVGETVVSARARVCFPITNTEYLIKSFQARPPSSKQIIDKLTCSELFELLKETGGLKALAEKLNVNYHSLSSVIHKKLRECFYTVPETASILGLHPETVRDRIKKGKIPAAFYGNYFLIPKWLIGGGCSEEQQ